MSYNNQRSQNANRNLLSFVGYHKSEDKYCDWLSFTLPEWFVAGVSSDMGR